MGLSLISTKLKIMIRSILASIFLLVVFQHHLRAQDSTYRGREFWAGYGHHQFMEMGQTNAQTLVFYLCTQQDPATVAITIDSASTPWTRTYNIPANTVFTSDAIPKSGASDARLYSPDPAFGGSGSSGVFRRKGIHIESDVPIAVYSHLYGSSSSGASLLLPAQTWGYSYQSINSRQSYAANCFSWAYVVAKENNTLIEITPTVLTKSQNLTGMQQGVATTVTLQKGQIYQLLGANSGADANGNGGTSTTGFELTGTRVRSLSAGKPIAVFSGSSRTYHAASCGSGGGDNDMAQLFPLHIWGKEYLTAPTSASTSASVMHTNSYKILVHDPLTVVKKDGVVLTGLLNNSYYTFESNQAHLIVADQPIAVAQYMHGGSACITGVGDPDMYYLSPTDAGIKKVNVVRTNREGISINYVTLIIPTGGVSSLLIDGSSSFNHSYVHPTIPGYTVVVKSWPSAIGQYTIQSDSSFTGISYGMGPVESYGFNLGANFKPNNGLDPMVPMVWTGSVNADWFTAGNWNTGKIPSERDHVMIKNGAAFAPSIPASTTVSCKSVVVEDGASIQLGTNAVLELTGKQ